MKKIISLLVLATMATHSQAGLVDFFRSIRKDSANNPAISDPRNDQPVEQIEMFVSTQTLKIRSEPKKEAKQVGVLTFNDRVRVIDPTTVYDGNFVEVEIVKSISFKAAPGTTYFISKDYLAEKKIDYKEFTGKYFMVQNIASETIRVYERNCDETKCTNKMILESEVVVGENQDASKNGGKGRSNVGSFRIVGWTKFYEDPAGHYPAWFKEGYPEVPKPGSSGMAWFSNKAMPEIGGDKHGVMRGAFGWYTAFVGPNAMGQWTHGTIGWGEDKDEFIKRTKKFLTNIVSDPRSSGCTRTNNEVIAFLREHLPVGSPIIKVYAKEAIQDPALTGYDIAESTWDYILTRNKSDKPGKDSVLAKSVPNDQYLEEGTLILDQHPDAMPYEKEKKFRLSSKRFKRTGNVYRLKDEEFSGVYYVDSGLLVDYKHPKSLEVGGFKDETTPPFMDATLEKNIR